MEAGNTDCITAQNFYPKQGLYDPAYEHDACGIGFVARLTGEPEHDIVTKALTAVGNMAHRGGIHADGRSGDGAGVLTAIPLRFFARELHLRGIDRPVENLAVAMIFQPADAKTRARSRAAIAEILKKYALEIVAWRRVPTDKSALGARAKETCPTIEQALIFPSAGSDLAGAAYERALYLARKAIEAAASEQKLAGLAVPSLSSRTLIYKGLLVAQLLGEFYPDLLDPIYETRFAIFHQRFATNTFPSWPLAQPFHMLSHNGEINTIGGNVSWMRARESAWRLAEGNPDRAISDGGLDLAVAVTGLGPVVVQDGSDSAKLDNALELLVMGGRDPRHAMAMLVPQAWENVSDLDAEMKAFYGYHATLMESWDGPAALVFSDGRFVGLTLDRNGLRPARYLRTDDGLVFCGSEVGAVPVDESHIIQKGKVGPGQMIAVDLETGTFATDEEVKHALAAAQPYATWLAAETRLADAVTDTEPELPAADASDPIMLEVLQRAFGYTSEELTVILRPMLRDGHEPIGSMGDDTPPAVIAVRPRTTFAYLKQRFAEVTNPPIDPLREELVMSLSTHLGRRGDLMTAMPDDARLVWLESPVLSSSQLAALRSIPDPGLRSVTIDTTFPTAEGEAGLTAALDRIERETAQAVEAGAALLILSDRAVGPEIAPVPALLALGTAHQNLIKMGLRWRVGLIVESGEPREVHHLACLIGAGAEAVNPYLALTSVKAIVAERGELAGRKAADPDGEAEKEPTAAEAESNYIHALEKGLLKIMSKMGIATVDSYCGALVFEALGLDHAVVARVFGTMPARLGGADFPILARAVLANHTAAFAEKVMLPNPGFYKYKKDGEYHAFAPQVVHALQKAVAGEGSYEIYRTYSQLVHSRPPTELRDLLDFVESAPISLDEVEGEDRIVRRFSTAAMSHGSLSIEAHEALAVAMNRLGGLCNSGEGGEDPARYGDERNSSIKQVASARFGVTPLYLSSAAELQIKMAQGSKPGEGGQLPAHKVSEEIARIRHSTTGISLVSPPPHHDIYSIEDLSQLIYDLKQANPEAAVSVKLVSEAGVGTVAAGVAKAGADVILISGHSGGTGASPLSSIKNAGVNWELGLSEAQQTLVLNGLRGKVRLRTDGGLKTGRDVVMAALLGADEYSFGTTTLVAEGCLMARTCQSNNCPVGIATQRPELRAKFKGTPEQVIHFFMHIAREVREILAQLGAKNLNEIIGRTDLLHQITTGRAEADLLDLSAVLARLDKPGADIRNTSGQNGRVIMGDLNGRLLGDATMAVAEGRPLELNYEIGNRDRTVGATLSGAIVRRHGGAGLPEGTITVRFSGSAGQSFGAFLAPGARLLLEGEANDYVGKGMAGGEIAIFPSPNAHYAWHENTIAGNTLLYGATGGALYAAGRVGERFAVRNSGAVAVVEGVGDHGCEYMTGGVALVLGVTGRNFGAGMTGGLAYVLDEDRRFGDRCNHELVQLSNLTDSDEQSIRALLLRHLRVTRSARAFDLLSRWDSVRGLFWRVAPRGLREVTLPAVLGKMLAREEEHRHA